MIPVEGLKLSGVGVINNELVFNNKDLPKIPIAAGNVPLPSVVSFPDTNIAFLVVRSTVPAARLF
jgi:hypothetical protein